MPFNLGWTKQSNPEPKELPGEHWLYPPVEEDYSAEEDHWTILKSLVAEVSEMHVLLANFIDDYDLAMQRREIVDEPKTIDVNKVEVATPVIQVDVYRKGQSKKEKYLWTQKVINSRKDPLIVAHIQSCGMIRTKKAWKKHSSPLAVMRWAKKFDDEKWAKQVVITACPSCLPLNEQDLRYEKSIPDFWNNNAMERYLGFQSSGYTPKYLYP